VRILAPPGFAAPALAEVDAIELRPQILALLRRQLAIRSVGIDAPHIWLEQRADSLWNWAVKRPAGGPGSAAAANQRSGMALSIAKLSIANGAIDWHSQLLGMAIRAPLAAEIGLHADAALRNVRV